MLIRCRSTEEKVIGLEQELSSTKARLDVIEAEKQMVQQALDDKEGMLKERDAASQSSTGQVSALQEVHITVYTVSKNIE